MENKPPAMNLDPFSGQTDEMIKQRFTPFDQLIAAARMIGNNEFLNEGKEGLEELHDIFTNEVNFRAMFGASNFVRNRVADIMIRIRVAEKSYSDLGNPAIEDEEVIDDEEMAFRLAEAVYEINTYTMAADVTQALSLIDAAIRMKSGKPPDDRKADDGIWGELDI